MGIIEGSNRHRRGHGTLGNPGVWKCPSCGVENTTAVEMGCPSCGSGDPRKSTAPPKVDATRLPVFDQIVNGRNPKEAVEELVVRTRAQAIPRPAPAIDAPLVVHRLIEYVIRKPEDLATVLRNSLVGTLDMGWGTITATIVDTVDAQQQDRLGLARRQPGVWLANPVAMRNANDNDPLLGRPLARTDQAGSIPAPSTRPPIILDPHAVLRELEREEQEERMTTPVTGPAYSPKMGAMAQSIAVIGGPTLCYTLALALQNLLPELEANAEPEKFLTHDDALQLASALMQQVPEDWEGDQPTDPPLSAGDVSTLPQVTAPPAPPQVSDEARDAARQRVQGVAGAARPTAVPWDPMKVPQEG